MTSVAIGTTRGLERLIFFTDAVAAIAITLLVLPLIDPVAEAAERHGSAGQFLADNAAQLLSFGISFAVIARLWIVHHGIFEHVVAYSRVLVFLSLFWAFTLVVLPLPTSITAEFDPSPFTVGLYIGVMALNSLTLTLIVIHIYQHPIVESKEFPMKSRMRRMSIATTALFALAWLLGVFVPTVGYWALLVLFLIGPINHVLGRREAAGAASSGPTSSEP